MQNKNPRQNNDYWQWSIFFSCLPNRSKWPNCASSDRLTSMIDLGKIGELSFKSSISITTLNSLNMLCGVVIISALKRHLSTSRSHTVSRSIVVRVRKSPDLVSICSSSSPLTIWNWRSSNEAWNWASCPILPIYESAYINDADVFISHINEKSHNEWLLRHSICFWNLSRGSLTTYRMQYRNL